MSRVRQTVKIWSRLGDTWRQGGAVVLAIGAVLGLGVFATDHFMTAKRPPPAAVPTTAADDGEIYTGSILYMPDEGRICRQLLFDNQTGRITDNGYVDCLTAVSQNDDGTPKHWSVARMRVISSGFLQR